MTDAPPLPDRTIIWLLDRSRVADGRGFCGRARYLNYHSGPSGYGIQKKGIKLPLATGIAGHEGIAPILEWCRDNDELIVQGLQLHVPNAAEVYCPVPTAVVREGVAKAQAAYWKTVEARGFAYDPDNEEVKAITREQCYLVEGLIWAWVLEVLPDLLRRGRVLEVEHDDTYVFGCTCGLSDGVGTKEDHELRGCQGFGLMCKPDFLLETRLTKELEYHEFKTTSMDSPSFRDKWEVMIQMFAATLDAERRHGKHVQSIYVHGLIKGKRLGDYNPASGKYDGPKRQASPFCYGYRKPGNPPMEGEQWAATYEYWDDFEQKTKRLPKAYQKAGVWELPPDYLPADDPGMTLGEFWAKWIPGEVRRKQLVLLGPFSRQTQMVDHFVQEMIGEEQRWQEGLWTLHDLGMQILQEHEARGVTAERLAEEWWNLVWQDERFQITLDRVFPRSYECRRYGKQMQCQFEDPCLEREGWVDLLGAGGYILRRPHHRDELEQAIGRGLLIPEEGLAEGAEEAEG